MGKKLLQGVGTISIPGKPNSENFMCCDLSSLLYTISYAPDPGLYSIVGPLRKRKRERQRDRERDREERRSALRPHAHINT